jgi:hypothetical protein
MQAQLMKEGWSVTYIGALSYKKLVLITTTVVFPSVDPKTI